MSKKYIKWFVLLTLIVPMLLVACGGSAEEAVSDAADTVEEAASDVAEQAEEVVQEAEDAAQEVVEEAEAAMDEAEEAVEEALEVVEEVMKPCGPASEGPLAGVDPRGQTVVWWHNHGSSREELLIEIVDEYNETNECDITIEPLNQGNYNDIRDAVNASVASGELPAALVVGYQNDQAFYQLNESLVDLNDYLNDPHWGLSEDAQAEFYQSFFNQSIHVSYDNQRLGFPPNRSIELLHVNMSYLRDLGYDAPPTTPDEFVEMSCAAAAASESGVGGYVLRDSASALAAWTFAFGGDVSNEDGTGYVFNGDATVQAMEMLVELATPGEDGQVCAYIFDGFPNPEVASRNAVFAMGSSSGIPFYVGDFATVAEEAGTEPDEYVVAAIPHTTDEPVMNIYGGDVMIVKTTPEQQLAAWQFIKWFTSPEVQADWVAASNYFPTNSATVEFLDDYVDANPVYAQALDLLQYGKFEPQLISYQSVRDAAEEAYNAMIQGADIEATLDDLTERANELQEELLEEIGG